MKPFHRAGLLTFVTFVYVVTGARLTTSPAQIELGGSSPTPSVTVTCSPDAHGITHVYAIEIGRKYPNGSIQSIIRMTNTDSFVQVVDTSLQERMTTSGSINGATGIIQFILTDPRCADAACTYYCRTLYSTGTSGNDEATVRITIKTHPEEIEMSSSPDRIQYEDGQLIFIICSGKIGNQFDVNNLQSLWTWEWRPGGNEPWRRYPNDQNITYDPPTSSGDCQYTGSSTLVHTVSNEENGRQFRCSVSNEDYSAIKTFYLVGTGARLSTSPTEIEIGGNNPTSQLTLSCRPDARGLTKVLRIEIGKKSSTGPKRPIISMDNTDKSVQVAASGLQERMTASGSITGAAGMIQFILTDPRCADATTTYYCSTSYVTGSAGSAEATTTFTTRTYPEQVKMLPTPNRAQYAIGQVITFRCSGRIGNQFDKNNIQSFWIWEWRSADNELAPWTRYPSSDGITYERPTSTGECQYTGASTLAHTVTIADNGRQFRCSGVNEDYSDSKTIYVVATTTPIASSGAINQSLTLILCISIMSATNSMFLGN